MSLLFGVRVPGVLESFAEGFAAELSALGYRPDALKKQLRLMAHLSRWLDEQGMAGEALTPQVVDEFLAARRAAGYSIHRSPRALAGLLGFLREQGVAGPVCLGLPAAGVEELVERYRDYLQRERGLVVSSVRLYVRAVRPFLIERTAGENLELGPLTAGDVTGFVLRACSEGRPGKAATTVTALRSLLGFLHVEGLVASSLVGAVPSVASWRLADLPRGLGSGEVKGLLGACDRRSPIGRRDFAMLLLLVRLGLRAGEVAGLELDDIDWRGSEIVVRGKGDRHERLPLPEDAGRAVVGYLQRGRPRTAQDRAVFVRRNAPHRRLSSAAVSERVFAAGRRAGLGDVRAHRLRHTTATQLLAQGASLAEIGQLLRHRKALTTAIYAKVDRDALRGLARPWPGSAP